MFSLGPLYASVMSLTYPGARLFCFEKVNGFMGQRVTFAFHYIIYVPASLHTLQRHLLLGKQQSLIRRLLLSCMSTTYVGGPANCYWGVLFLKGQRVDGSTGQQVNRSNGSMGQRVTFTFTILYIHSLHSDILYMIADNARLTPTHCKKHTGWTGWRVNGSTGQWVKRVDGSLSLSLYYIW